MRSNRRPTPSMLVACAALILAVTGSAVAANRFLIIKSSQIKPGAVAFKSLNKKARARLRGHAGAAGAPGAPGAAGESGPTGAAGPSGPTGPVGQAAVLGFAQGGGASLPGSPNVTVDTQSITTTKTSDLLVLFSAQSTVATCGAQDCSANGGLYMDSSGIFGTYEAFGAVTANTSKSHPSALSVIVPNVAAGQHTVTYAFSTSGPLTINHPDTSGHFTLIALNHG